ncbi:MAG: DUF3352 domain-containing protein [Candidatus Omnitrophica bacterium]|nr:DUF3352 domain-containing protein [Candidatus Omnitrophota bacterium]
MKIKKFFLGVLYFIIAVVLLGVLAYFYMKIPLSVERILPKGPVAYVKIADVEHTAQKIITSSPWKTMLNLNYDILIEKKIMTADQKAMIEMIKENQEKVLNHFLFKKFLGKEITFAFYIDASDLESLKNAGPKQKAEDIQKFFSNLFVVTRIAPEAQVIESLAAMFAKQVSQGQAAQIEVVTYKGHQILMFKSSDKGVDIGITRIKDLLVLGLGDKAVKAAIDVVRNEKPSLASDSGFTDIQKHELKPATIEGYVNFLQIAMILKDQIKSLKAQEQTAIENIFPYKAIGLSVVWDNLPKVKIDIQMSDKQKTFSSSCALDNQSIPFVPDGALGYAWYGCLDLNGAWEMAKKDLQKEEGNASPKDAQSSSRAKAIEEKIGFKIEQDILPIFGKEIGGYLANIDVQKTMVVPQLVFFVEIKDKAKSEALMEKLLSKTPLRPKEENYAGTAIHYMELPFENLGPAYCYLDKYLLVGVNRDLLKKSLDLYAKKTGSLMTPADFKGLDPSFSQKNLAVVFVRVNQIMLKIQDVVRFIDGLFDIQAAKVKAFQAGTQKRLEELQNNIVKNEETSKRVQKDLGPLNDAIWDLEAKNLDRTAEEQKKKAVETQIQALAQEVQTDRKTVEELKVLVTKCNKTLETDASWKIYFKEFIIPVLSSFSTINSVGTRQIYNGNILETTSFFKLQK